MINKSIKKVQFCTNRLQTGNRIKLPDNLISTLKWEKGQIIVVELDTETSEVILKAQ
jgi:hypothetical protein